MNGFSNSNRRLLHLKVRAQTRITSPSSSEVAHAKFTAQSVLRAQVVIKNLPLQFEASNNKFNFMKNSVLLGFESRQRRTVPIATNFDQSLYLSMAT